MCHVLAMSKANLDPACERRSLVQELRNHINEVQSCFISLLADPKSKHLSRESCCLGLAACRSLAKESSSSDDINETLLRAFGQTTNFGGSAMQETRVQADHRRQAEGLADTSTVESNGAAVGMGAEVGGASGIGEAELGAYRYVFEL